MPDVSQQIDDLHRRITDEIKDRTSSIDNAAKAVAEHARNGYTQAIDQRAREIKKEVADLVRRINNLEASVDGREGLLIRTDRLEQANLHIASVNSSINENLMFLVEQARNSDRSALPPPAPVLVPPPASLPPQTAKESWHSLLTTPGGQRLLTAFSIALVVAVGGTGALATLVLGKPHYQTPAPPSSQIERSQDWERTKRRAREQMQDRRSDD